MCFFYTFVDDNYKNDVLVMLKFFIIQAMNQTIGFQIIHWFYSNFNFNWSIHVGVTWTRSQSLEVIQAC